MVIRLFILLLLMIWAPFLVAGELTAQVDRFEIGINESVELRVTLADARGQRPDLTEVYKDFSIDSHSQSTSMNVVNGVMSQRVIWSFLLSPNRKGTLTIPSLKVGALNTDPIEIKVGDSPVAQSTSDDVLMEVEVRPLHPYVGGQVIYIQRLYYSRPLIDNASISRPEISQGEADVEFLGSSNPRYVKHNGRPYQLIERYYAIFPKHSGVLHFSPSVFRGSLASSTSRQNRFSMPMFQTGTRVNAYSPKAELAIAGKPASFTGEHWLPASQVRINMNWSQPPSSLTAGEPVTVTVAIMAEGVKAETLPEVSLGLPDTVKIYPEQPNFRSDKGGAGITGLREEKYTLIANKAGEYQVPEIEVPWWNTNTDKQEVAHLDGFTMNVGAGGAAVNSKPGVKNEAPTNSDSAGEGELKVEAEKQEQALSIDEPVTSPSLREYFVENKVLVLSMLSVIAVLLVGGFTWRRAAGKSDQSSLNTVSPKQKESGAPLYQACRDNDASAAIRLLPQWAAGVGINPATLAGIEYCGDTQLQGALRELTKVSYSREAMTWDGSDLLEAINSFSAHSSSTPDSPTLLPLHPIS